MQNSVDSIYLIKGNDTLGFAPIPNTNWEETLQSLNKKEARTVDNQLVQSAIKDHTFQWSWIGKGVVGIITGVVGAAFMTSVADKINELAESSHLFDKLDKFRAGLIIIGAVAGFALSLFSDKIINWFNHSSVQKEHPAVRPVDNMLEYRSQLMEAYKPTYDELNAREEEMNNDPSLQYALETDEQNALEQKRDTLASELYTIDKELNTRVNTINAAVRIKEKTKTR